MAGTHAGRQGNMQVDWQAGKKLQVDRKADRQAAKKGSQAGREAGRK